MNPPKSRKSELAANAVDGEKSHAEAAEFKMTELGPIPVDWEVKRLGEIVNILDNRRVPLSESQRKSGSFPYCGANGIVDYIDRYEFDEEAVLIAEDGGNFADFATRPIAYKMCGKYWVNNHAHVLTVKAGCDLDYLLFHLSHKDITDLISGGTRAKLTRGQLESIIVPLPPLAEQRRIARALSDVDELILALGKLIEKKRNIKTGAMQELLGMRNEECGMRNVPRRRLAGFSGEWIEKRLGDYAVVARGGSPRPIEAFLTSHDDGLNWVKIGDVGVGAKYIERTAEKILPSGLSSTRMVYPGDFLLSNSMSFGRPYIMKITGCIHDGWLVIQDYKSTFDTEYLYYVLGSEMVVNQYRVLAAGSSVLNLNKDVVASVIVVVPPTLAEQKAIAAVLSDIDAEIAALEADRAKYERIKSGMMQELLTGKTRLKP